MYFQHAEVPVRLKLSRVWTVLHYHIIWSTSWFVITLGIAIPSLVNPVFMASEPGQLLRGLYSWIVVFSFVVSLFLPMLDLLLQSPRSPERRWWRVVWSYLLWNLLPLFMLVFAALPGLEAQTRLMLGEKLVYQVTEKA